MSALDEAGLTTTFGNGKGVTWKLDGTIILTSQKVNGMYLLGTIDTSPNIPLAMVSLSQPTMLKQWHHHFAHCNPLTSQDMVSKSLVDDLMISETTVNRKCKDCILGCQTRRPFDGETEKNLTPLELIASDLWGPSCVKSAGGKVYVMIIVDARTSYKCGAYLPDKSDTTTISTFKAFHTKAKTTTGRKIH